MRTTLGQMAVALLLAVVPAAQAQTPVCSAIGADGFATCSLSVPLPDGGALSRAYLQESAGSDPTRSIVLWLHDSQSLVTACRTTGWAARCASGGCVLICPRAGTPHVLTDGGTHGFDWNFLGVPSAPDDVGFLRVLAETLPRVLPADPARVDVVGYGEGGLMANLAATLLSNDLAAIGVEQGTSFLGVDGGVPSPHAQGPVSVINLNATGDESFFACGQSAFGLILASMDDAFDHWAVEDGCEKVTADAGTAGDPTFRFCSTHDTATVPGGALTSVTVKHATKCQGGTEVLSYELFGGSHTVSDTVSLTTPPGTSALPFSPDVNLQTGITELDLLANFFSSHPRPPDAGAGTSDAGSGPFDAGQTFARGSQISEEGVDHSYSCGFKGGESGLALMVAGAFVGRRRGRKPGDKP